MILLDEDSSQRPKLPTDPSLGPTNRVNPVEPISSQRVPSPNLTLPDYEASQAQHPSPNKRGFQRRFWHTRVGKVISYSVAVYAAIFIVIGIPAIVVRWNSSPKFRWHGDDSFLDYGPLPQMPPSQLGGQFDLSFHNYSFSCSPWVEPVTLHGKHNTTAVMSSMHLAFPLGDGIKLRTNSSSENLKDYVSGNLTVNMNPDKNVSNIVLVTRARSSSLQLLSASSVCLTSFGNTTELMIKIPDGEESHRDTIDFDIELLLPWTPAPIKTFAAHLPMFNQTFGDLGPHVEFRSFKLAGYNPAVTIDSVRASSITIRTSGARISGNFSVLENILLDNINGAIYANVSLVNKEKWRSPTKLKFETGNGPIVAQVNLQVDERSYFSMGRSRPNFITSFKTFNAPMNVSIAHHAESEPARFKVTAENTQGAIAMTLDSVYTGAFDLRAKAAKTLVKETVAPGGAKPTLDEEHELHFEHVSSEWTRGWIGDDRRPKSHHHDLNHVELTNSLSPIELRLARLKPSTAIRR